MSEREPSEQSEIALVEAKASQCRTLAEVLALVQGTYLQDWYTSEDDSRHFSAFSPAMKSNAYTIADDDRDMTVQIDPTARVRFLRSNMLAKPAALFFILLDPPSPEAPDAEHL